MRKLRMLKSKVRMLLSCYIMFFIGFSGISVASDYSYYDILTEDALKARMKKEGSSSIETLGSTIAATAFLSNDRLKLYFNERNSNVWQYKYDVTNNLWGESCFHEHFAIWTPGTGIAESENYTVSTVFSNPGGGAGTITAVLETGNFQVTRTIVLEGGDKRSFQMIYKIKNISQTTVNDVRFFEEIDFDIPTTESCNNDYACYDPASDYIGIKDAPYFENGMASNIRSSAHGIDFWNTEIYTDWDDGQLNGQNSYGPGDPAIGKQFNLGNLGPGQEKEIILTIWSGSASTYSGELQLVDPQYYPDFFNNFKNLNIPTAFSNPYLDPYIGIATGGNEVHGVVADGVTKLLLRFNAPAEGEVKFKLNAGNGHLSHVTSWAEAGTEISTNTRNVNGANKAFAIYNVPDAFQVFNGTDDKLQKDITITVSFTANNSSTIYEVNKSLSIYQVPLIISHGWMSDPDPFAAYASDYKALFPSASTSDRNLFVQRLNWKSAHFRDFDNASEVAMRDLKNCISNIRIAGIATTQVDFLGHSMGGIMGRYIQSKSESSQETYASGYIHKLISLDTPHAGSIFANAFLGTTLSSAAIIEVLRNTCVRVPITGSCLISAFDLLGGLLQDSWFGIVFGGATYDLTTPRCLLLLNEITVPARSIVGNFALNNVPNPLCWLKDQNPSNFITPIKEFITILKLADRFGWHCESLTVETNMDLIVGINSQKGGLSSNNSKELNHIHTAAINNPLTLPHVFEMMVKKDKDDINSFAAKFPAALRILSFEALFAENVIWPNSMDSYQMKPLVQIQSDKGVRITSPSDSANINLGSTVTITVETYGGLQVEKLMILTSNSELVAFDAPPFTTTVTIPLNYSDDFRVTAIAFDANGVIYSADIVTNITVINASLQSIEVSPESTIMNIGDMGQIYVKGNYSDGVERDLTFGGKGTTYTPDDTSMIDVSANGLVSAKKSGTCIVLVKNGAFTKSVGVRINNALSLYMADEWSLISLPFQPDNTNIGSVLSDIGGGYNSVWAFVNGSWKTYVPSIPGFSDLTSMEAGLGYWINRSGQVTMQFLASGNAVSSGINLNSGWNLVGYNSLTSHSITDALSSIAGKVVSVWAYKSGAWQFYDPTNPGFSDLTTMSPGYGYWINTNGACTWTLP